ncbi:MAG: hypothetical protein KAT34_18490 [Candidatus Aminicenantes bacterium]|nr:hypothetical protein [Candidatus Aminicenantes bacterium]
MDELYNEKKCPLPDDLDLEGYIENCNKHFAEKKKEKSNKVSVEISSKA